MHQNIIYSNFNLLDPRFRHEGPMNSVSSVCPWTTVLRIGSLVSNRSEISYLYYVNYLCLFYIAKAWWNSNRDGIHIGLKTCMKCSHRDEMSFYSGMSLFMFWTLMTLHCIKLMPNLPVMKHHVNRMNFHPGLKSQTRMNSYRSHVNLALEC